MNEVRHATTLCRVLTAPTQAGAKAPSTAPNVLWRQTQLFIRTRCSDSWRHRREHYATVGKAPCGLRRQALRDFPCTPEPTRQLCDLSGS